MKHIALIFDTIVLTDADVLIGHLNQRCKDWTISQHQLALSEESITLQKPDESTSFLVS